jgi:hypothetical protein
MRKLLFFVALCVLACVCFAQDRAKPPPFIPTDEWQEVLEGQSIPKGLHVRMDMSKGGRWAKKLAPEPADAAAGVAAAAAAPAVLAGSGGGGLQLAVVAEEGSAPPPPSPTALAAPVGLSPQDEVRSRVLLSLPEPEPALVDAVRAALPPDELSALLARVWDKRQEQIRDAWAAAKSEGQQMAAALGALAGAGGAPLPAADVAAALEDLEFHVANVHNAEDFAAMGGLSAMVRLLNASAEGVPARAAWVIGTAVKGQGGLIDVALADGAAGGVVALMERALAGAEGGAGGGEEPLRTLAKALYAAGALTRAHAGGQRAFSAGGGASLLRRALAAATARGGATPAAKAVAAKALRLVADLALPVGGGGGAATTTSDRLRLRLDGLAAGGGGERNESGAPPPPRTALALEGLQASGEQPLVKGPWAEALAEDAKGRAALCGAVRAALSTDAGAALSEEDAAGVATVCGGNGVGGGGVAAAA